MSWLVGLPVAALWLAASLWLGQRTAHETAEMFDRELERTAASVLVVLASVPETSLRAADLDDVHGDEGPRGEIVVRDRGGRLLLDASVLPPLPAGPDAPHFHTVVHDGDRWRVFQRRDAGGLAERLDADELAVLGQQRERGRVADGALFTSDIVLCCGLAGLCLGG